MPTTENRYVVICHTTGALHSSEKEQITTCMNLTSITLSESRHNGVPTI